MSLASSASVAAGLTARLLVPTLRAMLVAGTGLCALGDDTADLRRDLDLLRRQNERLQQQLDRQQVLINELTGRVNRNEPETGPGSSTAGHDREAAVESPGLWKLPGGPVRLSAEGGLSFSEGRTASTHPNSDFRVDEARLFLEAKVWEDVYAFSEINLATREDFDEGLNLGELYVDLEDVSKLWGRERLLNVRLGRIDIPFGEEYLTRDAIDNPLVAHSLADFWGIDEGAELYGSIGQVSYVLAVQNGGHPPLRDYTGDKSVTARIGWDPKPWLHASVSVMRTGSLDVAGDKFSELWIGGAFFRGLGPSPRTTRFHAELAQGDLQFLLPHGHLKLAGGAAGYDDDDPLVDHRRRLFHWSAEGLHKITRRLYAAARFSEILAPDGFPIAGQGTFGEYFFRTQSTEVWRATVGAGFRFSDNLLLKADYSLERGEELGGSSRKPTDLFSAEIAIRY